jgi:mannose-6-phosphate isomerase
MEPVWHLTVDGIPASHEAEGFVHASFAGQLMGTLAAHFAGADQIVLLRLDPETLGAALVLEASRDDQLFPHIYRAIAPEDVIERRRLSRGADGSFDLSAVPGAIAGQAGHVPLLSLGVVGVKRPWGGTRIARRFGWDSAAPHGEWWLLSCHPRALTPVRGGPSLAAWVDGPGQALGLPPAAEFPLLLKFLDAEQHLSVQVHPDDSVAEQHGLPHGKTEAWHLLEAAEDAWLAMGTGDGVTAADLAEAVDAGGDEERVLACLSRHKARPGDTWIVEAGTIHALGAGISCFEVQQNSDVTYRIYDWNREPRRELHLALARDAAIEESRGRSVGNLADTAGWTTLLDESAFRLSRSRPSAALELVPRGAFASLTVLAGSGNVTAGAVSIELTPGCTLLVFEAATVSGEGLDLLVTEPPL